MRDQDRQAILDMIQKLKAKANEPEAVVRCCADLATVVLMASEPELEWAEQPPVILTQGARTYRAYPITCDAA